ncbi:MAG: DUF2256 domain-containing protein [Terriglobales bacterium]
MDNNSLPPQPDIRRIPPKTCLVCGGPIQWRRRRAANWDTVKYCSAACRRAVARPSSTPAGLSAAA